MLSTSSTLRNQARKSLTSASASIAANTSSPSSSSSSSCSSHPPYSSTLTSPQRSPSRSFATSHASKKFSVQHRDESNSIPSPQLTPVASSDPNALAQYFHSSIHPNINLPNRVALQAITHESWDMGTSLEGNNRRLAFIGRRALKFYLTLFLSSLITSSPSISSINKSSSNISQQETEAIDFLLSDQSRLDNLLHTTDVLGDRIGREWGLEKVMRWRAALGEGRRGGKETGLFKIRGTCFEGVLGAIYHQQGALVASNVFHSKILPHLLKSFPKSLSNSRSVEKEVERRRKEAERGLDSISSASQINFQEQEGVQQAVRRELERKAIKEDARINDEAEQNQNQERFADQVSSSPTSPPSQIKRSSSPRTSKSSTSSSTSSSSIPPHQAPETMNVDSTTL